MRSRVGGRKKAECVAGEHVSLLGRAASWVILKLLGVMLLTALAGVGFAAYRFLVLGDAMPAPPLPFSPAAVAASPAPPIDYRQHPPPAGLTDNVPLPRAAYASPPPAAGHVPPHRPPVPR